LGGGSGLPPADKNRTLLVQAHLLQTISESLPENKLEVSCEKLIRVAWEQSETPHRLPLLALANVCVTNFVALIQNWLTYDIRQA